MGRTGPEIRQLNPSEWAAVESVAVKIGIGNSGDSLLKKLLSEAELDQAVLKENAKGNSEPDCQAIRP